MAARTKEQIAYEGAIYALNQHYDNILESSPSKLKMWLTLIVSMVIIATALYTSVGKSALATQTQYLAAVERCLSQNRDGSQFEYLWSTDGCVAHKITEISND